MPILPAAGVPQNFNPRPPRGERQCVLAHQAQNLLHFNPRPPRGERPLGVNPIVHDFGFQSTPSARRATCGAFWQVVGSLISIHALREESDLRQAAKRQSFYKFQSTPSARRATTPGGGLESVEGISIHALREEGDPTAAAGGRRGRVFQSTPSARRATNPVFAPF